MATFEPCSLKLVGPLPASNQPRTDGGRANAGRGGLRHLTFLFENIAETFAKLEQAGVELKERPGVRACVLLLRFASSSSRNAFKAGRRGV